MKVSVDCQCQDKLFELSAVQKQVLCNDMHSDVLDQDLKRRLEYILMHKYDQCFKRLKEEWEPKLAANGVESMPLDKDAFAQLVFSQPNYMDRKAREEQAIADEAARQEEEENPPE